MGAIGHFSCNSRNTASPNPNPSRFTIKRIDLCGLYTVCLVNYPDCTTYGGDKVMVYEEGSTKILNTKKLDPHFIEGQLSPIARFPGSATGWQHAKIFAMTLRDCV